MAIVYAIVVFPLSVFVCLGLSVCVSVCLLCQLHWAPVKIFVLVDFYSMDWRGRSLSPLGNPRFSCCTRHNVHICWSFWHFSPGWGNLADPCQFCLYSPVTSMWLQIYRIFPRPQNFNLIWIWCFGGLHFGCVSYSQCFFLFYDTVHNIEI